MLHLARHCLKMGAISQELPEGAGASQSSAFSSPHAHLRTAAPLGAGSDDLAEGSVRFFHDDLRLSLPINGEYTLSLEALKNTSPRDIICLYEVCSLRMPHFLIESIALDL